MTRTNFSTILKRELEAYFNSAIAYIFIIIFVLINGGLYMTQFFLIGRADMRPFFSLLPFLLAVFLPAVTMRLWAEERKGNTLELLLTFPMTTGELVVGKFIASFVFYLAALAGTFTIPVMLAILGRPDMGAIWGGYLGAALLGAFFLSLGLFISGLCRDQIVAFILAMMICLGLYLVGTEFMAASIDGWLPGLGTLLRRFLGLAAHFDSFAKGVVDNRDLLYFLLGTGIFLFLNGLWLEGRMRPKARTLFTVACIIAAGIFFMGNWFLSGLPLGRFDLSEGKIYTVSPASKKILRELKTPVTVKFYVSPVEKMPSGMKTLEQDAVDKLDEFRLVSGGKLKYKIFHMEAANVLTEEESAEGKESLTGQLSRKGIEPFQVQSIEADEVGVKLVYASISLAYKEKFEEIIPRIMPETLDELEYLLLSKIYRMTLPETPRVALVAPYEEKSVDPQMAALLAQLGGGQIPGNYREDRYEVLPEVLQYEGYEISRIRLTKEEPIPEGTKTLMIAEPQGLTDRQRFEISRFLAGGGSVLLAVQNYEYDYTPAGRRLEVIPVDKKPGVNDLLKNWGVTIDDAILVDSQHEMINMGGAAQLGPFAMSVPVKLPIQILITPSQMNKNLSITSRLSSMFYLWGAALQADENKLKSIGLKATTLFTSSQDSWTIPFQREPLSAENFRPKPESRHGPLPLAVLLEGAFPDVYAGKPAPPWSGPEPQPPGQEGEKKEEPSSEVLPPVSPAPGKLLLIGAATPFQKQLVQGGGHLNFFLNAVDALTLGDELVTIRSKQPIDRSIGLISTPSKLIWRFFATLLIPFLIAGIGAFRMVLRSRSKQNYLKTLEVVS